MKHISNLFFFLFLLLAFSCEDSEVDSTNPFIGKWYVESAEQFAEFMVSANQTAIPIGPNVAGYRQFDGGITVSGSGMDIVLDHGYPTSLYYLGNEELVAFFSNYGYFELLSMEEDDVLPSDFTLLQITGDSAMVIIFGSDIGISNTSYMGPVDINWNINPTNRSTFLNLNSLGDLNYFSFNTPATLSQWDSNESITLNGSMQFATLDLVANTSSDLFELMYGMTLSELNALMGNYDDYFFGENDNLEITFSDDGKYSLVSSWEESDYNGYDETSEIISDTCTGQWTINGDTLMLDLSTEVCSGDDWGDDEYYYEDEPNENELLIGVINSNGNLELSLIEGSGFCDYGISMITESPNYYSNYSEEECASMFESEFALASGTAKSMTAGIRLEFTSTMGNTSLRSKNSFNHALFNELLSGKPHSNKWSIPLPD